MHKRTDGRSTANDQVRNLRRLAVGYARVSTTRQGEKGTSLEAQRAAIETFANAADFTLIETFDDVASGVGVKSFYNREKLQAALNLVVREGAVLIVWDWDRLSRHAGFERQVKKVLLDPSRVICASDGSNMHEASRAAKFAHGEQTAANISRTTREGMAKKRAQGATFGNPEIVTDVQPLGTATWSKMRADHDLAIADVLRESPNPMVITRAQAADLLNQSGLQSLQGKEWTKSRVTEPLKRARAILMAEEEEQMAAIPQFGMF